MIIIMKKSIVEKIIFIAAAISFAMSVAALVMSIIAVCGLAKNRKYLKAATSSYDNDEFLVDSDDYYDDDEDFGNNLAF